jgi:hypothetical protein
MNVLDAPIREMDLMPKENSPTHRNALVIEAIAQDMVLEIMQNERNQKGRSRQQTLQDVIAQKPRQRSLDIGNRCEGCRHLHVSNLKSIG